MAKKRLIARAGRGLVDVLALLLRGVGILFAAFGSILLFVFKHEDVQSTENSVSDPHASDRIVGQDEAGHYGWDSW